MKAKRLQPSWLFLLAFCGCQLKFCCHAQAQKNDAKQAAVELSKLVQEIKTRGEPTTLAELDNWYPKPRDGQNAAALYEEAFAALSGTNFTSSASIARNKRTLELLHNASAIQGCRYPVDLSRGASALLPHLAKIKACGQLLREATIENARLRKPEAAGQTCLDSLCLAQSLAGEPLLISQLVRLASLQLGASALEQALAKHALPEARLITLQSLWHRVQTRENADCARALASERAITMSIIHTTPDQLRKNLSSFIRVSGAKEMPGDIEEFLKKCDQAMLDQEALFYLDRMTAWIESAKRDLKDAAMVAAKLESEPDSKSHPVAMIFLSGLPKGLQRISNNSGFVRATEAALAVERYRNANNGNLPDSLEQLVPQQLREIPSDPFDGKPIRYKRLAQGGYATYSIGPDMKDNDAMPSPSLGQLGRPGSDLVFAVQR